MRPSNQSRRGFTLVELLIVMLIIGVLMGILVPTLARAVRTVRSSMTRGVIRDLEFGLEAYKKDFGDYPPSERDASTYPRSGQEKLVFYMRGPRGTGWGAGAAGSLPEGVSARRTRTYGPYYEAGTDRMRYATVGGESRPVAFLDYFEPAGGVLYFRSQTSSTGQITFNWNDNNLSGSDSEAKTNYSSHAYFEDCVVVSTGSATSTQKRYYSDKYLLISPGLDGRFGAIERTESGDVIPTMREEGSYDDITNWN